MNERVTILLHTDDPQRRVRWHAALGDDTLQVIDSAEEACSFGELDVLVADQPLTSGVSQRIVRAVRSGQIGLVATAPDIPGDVELPPSASDRELRLAVQLVAQIARLRRCGSVTLRMAGRLAGMAFRDPLTDIPNRRAWECELDVRWRAARAPGRCLCLALLDLDQFKSINDTGGHQQGDHLLRRVARNLTAALPRDGFVARIGGDEFAVLVEVSESETASRAVDRLRQTAVAGQEGDVVTSASAGFALSTQVTGPGQLFDAADRALGRAKRAGGDRTVGGGPV